MDSSVATGVIEARTRTLTGVDTCQQRSGNFSTTSGPGDSFYSSSADDSPRGVGAERGLQQRETERQRERGRESEGGREERQRECERERERQTERGRERAREGERRDRESVRERERERERERDRETERDREREREEGFLRQQRLFFSGCQSRPKFLSPRFKFRAKLSDLPLDRWQM